MYQNPFTPVFGNEPLILAGRDRIIGDILKGLDNGKGDPNRVTVFMGPRGSGKTVLLAKIATAAESRGWVGVHVTTSPRMLKELLEQVERKAAEFIHKKSKRRLSGIQVSGTGFSLESVPDEEESWRIRMSDYLDTLNEQGIGLLITIDEVTPDEPDLIYLVSTFQIFIMEKREVALLMAGLPEKVMQMSLKDPISFLRRAFHRNLDPISQPEVRAAMKKTIEYVGREINSKALACAAEATQGFPFMIQLIGYHTFNQSERKSISLEDAHVGIEDAREDMETMILNATVKSLTERDRAFLDAMLQDEDESKMSDISSRLGIKPANADFTRKRLVKQGVIHQPRRGMVAFGIPMLRDLLAERRDRRDSI
jgi:hypothetical protein